MKRGPIAILIILTSFTCYAQPSFIGPYPDTLVKKKLYGVIATETATYLSGLYFLKYIWYTDHERVPFHWYNDAKGYLQLDKCGHAFAAYRYSYAAYHALRKAGADKKHALIYGGPVGLIFQTPVEIFDGLYEGWGFSWADMAANAFGPALLVAQEAIFDGQVFHMKFSYSPSPYPKYHPALGENQLESFFYDYNAHTYWLSGNLHKLTGLQQIPSWLNIAFGYSANGMIKEFSNPTWYDGKPFPYLERYRQYILSLDVDFSQIPVKNKFLKGLFRTVNLVKVPFPALEFSRVDKVKPYIIYF